MVSPCCSRAFTSSSRTRAGAVLARCAKMSSISCGTIKSAHSCVIKRISSSEPSVAAYVFSIRDCCVVRVAVLDFAVDYFNCLRGRAVWNVLAVDHHGWAALAFFKAESSAHIDAAFQIVLLRVAQHAIQHFLRSLQEAVRPQADAHFDFVRARRLHQRQRFIPNAAAALIAGMQKMMRLLSAYLAEELRIAFGNEDVVLRLMKLQNFVRMIEALGALLPCVEMAAHAVHG